MHTLYLTDAEAKKFAKLSDALKSGVSVETEKISYEDSPRRRGIRFELLTVTDPELVRLRDAMKNAKSEAETLKVIQSLDVKKIDNAQFTHMLFAMGPGALGLIIEDLFTQAKSADDIEAAAAYSTLRHGMLESLDQYSPKEP